MRALVLSGGEGSRLRPLTHTSAKQLIPVAGKPILFHALESIRDAGITEVGVVVADDRPTGAEVRAAVGDGSPWGLRVTFIGQEAPLGIAHAVTVAAEFLGDQPFLLYLGDNVLLGGVARFVEAFERERPSAHILLSEVEDPQRFGVAVMDGDRVVRLVEKPTEHLSDLALVGIYLFDPGILEACATLRPSGRGEYEITEAIQWLIDEGRDVRAERVTGYWKDTGRPDDLLEANRTLLSALEPAVAGDVDPTTTTDGPVVVAAGARVVASRLIGPIVVGPGCVIERSTIGPNVSLEPGCQVRDSEIEDAILMGEARVEGVKGLRQSILGRGAHVRHSGASGIHRMIVGDQSSVEVD